MIDWQITTVAPDTTHHLVHGRALYLARFIEVLKFHAPGLAPVRGEDGACHIDVEGRAAYAARFLRTFGFYEGRAAVAATDGWHHIQADGSPVYAERYAWCGNYQGGRCTVRGDGGHYLHLDQYGAPVYAERFRYAGDYREGVAVVQRDDGLHTHVDHAGQPTHGRWFRDLDVFHKSFARARDEAGWTHIDRVGRPVYARRFAMAEPFYNGQARVERHGGGLEVIDERGEVVVELPARVGVSPPRPLPAGLLATLGTIARTEAAVLLIRHADRHPLAPGIDDREAEISEEGGARAESLGRILQARDGFWVETSPLFRCRRTAERILEGAARTAVVAANELLGDPGPFVVDPRGGGVLFASLGVERLVRGQIAGEMWPPLRPTADGVRLLVGDLARRLRTRGGTGICVSHDAIVMPVIAALTGEQFEEAWLDPLDGVALTIGAGGRIQAIWRGTSVEIDP
jgi:Histidine phosphatase superfamily (branch 1)